MAVGAGLGHLQTLARNQGRSDLFSEVIFRTVMPAAKPLARMADGLHDFLYGVVQAPSLQARDRALKARISSLQLYAEQIDLLNQQIEILRKQLSLGPIAGHERVNLDVIGFSQDDGSLTLSGGSELGIQPDMPVINGEGLVGVVQSVSRGRCQAALITTFGVKIGGIDVSRKPPERGLLKGRGATTLSMWMFDPKAPVASGDKVVTGGLSLHIPYGLIIGRVISVEEDPYYGTRRATLDPAVNVGLLREVQILK